MVKTHAFTHGRKEKKKKKMLILLQERVKQQLPQKTVSYWSYVLSNQPIFRNEQFDASNRDPLVLHLTDDSVRI
jgi:hypothetical protein